ncbi:MAG TPA: hypothetical protein PKA38_00940 [Candidatus Levybacteria bacterium]|nr:hypothetical protein [Candidatus Levybacteria bacterium]
MSKMIERVTLRFETKRKEQHEKGEGDLAKTWGKLMKDKKQEAGDLPSRFAFKYSSATERSYYTFVEHDNTKLVFDDIDRDQNTGVRQCVVLHDGDVTLLATVKPVGWDGRDKHRWEVVADSQLQKLLLESIYGSFKNAPVFDPKGKFPWKGLYPDTTEVLKILRSEGKM